MGSYSKSLGNQGANPHHPRLQGKYNWAYNPNGYAAKGKLLSAEEYYEKISDTGQRLIKKSDIPKHYMARKGRS